MDHKRLGAGAVAADTRRRVRWPITRGWFVGAQGPSLPIIWICVLSALAVVAGVGSAIAYFDVGRAVADRRSEELRRLELNAERSAGQIESQLLEESRPTDLETVRNAVWLRRYWTRTLSRQPGRIYATVTDRKGLIIAHTDRKREGLRLAVADGEDLLVDGPELVETTELNLTGGRRALDMRIPILANDVPLGVYRTGLDADWLDRQLDNVRRSRTTFWALIVGGMCGLLLLSSVAVVHVTRHTAHLEHALEAAHARRVSEMHELVVGIAHEVRNPLNAIRLNTHSLGQILREGISLSPDEISAMLDEMTDDIERLETLMRQMLGFTRTERDPSAATNVNDEMQRAVALLRPQLERQRIEVRVQLAEEPCTTPVDAARMRQILLNLLHNAADALGQGGHIDVLARSSRDQVEIVVADDGPGIPAEDRERVFVPFYSTKASGTGLGLALARKFVEEAGGTIECQENLGRGCRFSIVLPTSHEPVQEAAV